MKFKQKDEQFRPVTITLETEKEVMLLATAIGKVSGDGVDGNLLYRLYVNLVDVASPESYYVSRSTQDGIRLYEVAKL